MTNDYSVAVLLPTRGRTDPLTRSVTSLFELCADPSRIKLVLAFDNDDTVGLEHFENSVQPWLDDHDIDYTAVGFERMGYACLNRYYNEMAKHARADWYFVWNDDAVMQTQGWDHVIESYTGQFCLLKIHTHNEHPYSIFPIVPHDWYALFEHFSRHQMIDAELSQIAYMLDLIQIVDIEASHERADLVGKKEDETDRARIRFEGNPMNSYDFHNRHVTNQRIADTERIAAHMNSLGLSTEWWNQVKAGKQDPWEKLRMNDINQQMVQYDAK
jgi:hypothetical protein